MKRLIEKSKTTKAPKTTKVPKTAAPLGSADYGDFIKTAYMETVDDLYKKMGIL